MLDFDGLNLDDDSGNEEDTDDDDDDDDDDDGADAEFNAEFRKYKANYYTDKMDFRHVTRCGALVSCCNIKIF